MRLGAGGLGAVMRFLLGELAVLVPPTPFANQRAGTVLSHGCLLAVLVPPDPDIVRVVVFVFACDGNLAVAISPRFSALSCRYQQFL